ncbi:MAG TPA: hypothetical protein VMU31_05100 [Rhizomicrobium sp.]|nr:hypothetical protein [Rhizomicrobium sp.]
MTSRTRRYFAVGALASVLGLCGCTQVDQMFDNGGAIVPAPAQGEAVHASARDAVRAASQRCDSITDERTWLDCYYGAAQPVRAEIGLPPAPLSQQKLVPAS